MTADVGNEGGDEDDEEDEQKGATGSRANPDQEVTLETNWYHTDPRVNSSFSSLSSGSLSAALEESSGTARGDPAMALSRLDAIREGGSAPWAPHPAEGLSSLDVHHPFLLEVPLSPQRQRKNVSDPGGSAPARPTNLSYRGNDSSCLCFAELSQADFLPSPPEATSDEEEEKGVCAKSRGRRNAGEAGGGALRREGGPGPSRARSGGHYGQE